MWKWREGGTIFTRQSKREYMLWWTLRLTMIHMSKRKRSPHGVQYSGHALPRSTEPKTEPAPGFSIKNAGSPFLPVAAFFSPRACVFRDRLHHTATPATHVPSAGDARRGQRCCLHRRGPHPPALLSGATQQLVSGCTAAHRGRAADRPLASPHATSRH